MTTIVVIVVVIVVVALAVGVAAAVRRRRLQQQFGPEYDRLAREHDSKRKAEAELAQRQRRVRKLDIKPLSAEAQAAYAAKWVSLQERFVDDPEDAVAQSQTLVASVMQDRGYPTEHSEQVMADLSVEHAKTIGNFRAAEEISSKATTGTASTEDLRQAMIHYRALFRDLLGDTPGPDDEPDVNEQVDADYAITDRAAATDRAATDRTVSGHVPAAATERDPARNGQVLDEPARDEPVYDEPVYDQTVRGDAASDPAVPPAADPATEDASGRPTRRS